MPCVSHGCQRNMYVSHVCTPKFLIHSGRGSGLIISTMTPDFLIHKLSPCPEFISLPENKSLIRKDNVSQ